jgi:hypothetical protein
MEELRRKAQLEAAELKRRQDLKKIQEEEEQKRKLVPTTLSMHRGLVKRWERNRLMVVREKYEKGEK